MDFIIRNCFFNGGYSYFFKCINIDNMIDPNTNKLVGYDYMTPITDCEGAVIQNTIDANGNYFFAIDTFYGKFGNLTIDMGSATTGKIRVAINSMFYGNGR